MPNFANAPLVEIVVEVRWGIGMKTIALRPGVQNIYPAFASDGTQKLATEFFQELIKQSNDWGLEQVLPTGVMAPPNQIAHRYRRSSESIMYQLGPGIFAINATPPYHSWDSFRPVVARGLESLDVCLERLSGKEGSDRTCSQISVRYIDGFKGDLKGNVGNWQFLSSTLNIGINLPKYIADNIEKVDDIDPMIQLSYPLKRPDTHQSIVATSGIVGAEPAFVLDSSTISTKKMSFSVVELLTEIDILQEYEHSLFIGAVSPIRAKLKEADI